MNEIEDALVSAMEQAIKHQPRTAVELTRLEAGALLLILKRAMESPDVKAYRTTVPGFPSLFRVLQSVDNKLRETFPDLRK